MCISPLSAIMIEQTEKFNTMGIKTEFIGEAQVNPCSQRRVLNGEARPGLTDCGALGKIILGGSQIKAKTKKKKKKRKAHTHLQHPFQTNQSHKQYSYPNTAAK